MTPSIRPSPFRWPVGSQSATLARPPPAAYHVDRPPSNLSSYGPHESVLAVECPAPPLTGASPRRRGPGVARGPGESPRAHIRIRRGASFSGIDARLALSLRSFLFDQRRKSLVTGLPGHPLKRCGSRPPARNLPSYLDGDPHGPGQAIARPKDRAANQTATAASTAMITTPWSTLGLLR